MKGAKGNAAMADVVRVNPGCRIVPGGFFVFRTGGRGPRMDAVCGKATGFTRIPNRWEHLAWHASVHIIPPAAPFWLRHWPVLRL